MNLFVALLTHLFLATALILSTSLSHASSMIALVEDKGRKDNGRNDNNGGLRGPPRKLEYWYSIGTCCNYSSEYEWILINVNDTTCEWKRIAPGTCVGGGSTDCEGMTCGGGFYQIPGVLGGQCVTPGYDSWPFTGYRWLPPNNACGDAGADGPSDRCGCTFTSLPPGYPWGPRPGKTCPPTPAPVAVVVTSAPLPTTVTTSDPKHHPQTTTTIDWEYNEDGMMTPVQSIDAEVDFVP